MFKGRSRQLSLVNEGRRTPQGHFRAIWRLRNRKMRAICAIWGPKNIFRLGDREKLVSEIVGIG